MSRSHLIAAAFAALLVAPAHAQDPADPATPDGMEMPPVEVVMGMDGEAPVCAPADFRLPVDNPVALMLRNEASTTLDFTAPELFEASVVAGREGGQAWVTQEGRAPGAGSCGRDRRDRLRYRRSRRLRLWLPRSRPNREALRRSHRGHPDTGRRLAHASAESRVDGIAVE